MSYTEIELIHYGAPEYIKSKFKGITSRSHQNKPLGGLWTSPIESSYGWKDWSEDNDFGDLSRSFKIKFSGDVLIIDNEADMLNLPWIDDRTIDFTLIDADAIHLTEKGEHDTRLTWPKSLYGWDCETFLIFNRDCIQSI